MKGWDYPCLPQGEDNNLGAAARLAGVSLPGAHCNGGEMYKLAKGLQEVTGEPFYRLPFCHTLEAEALGARVNYGDKTLGPRLIQGAVTSLDDFLKLAALDPGQGRMGEVLKAAEQLSQEGLPLVLEVTGALTLLGALWQPDQIFRTLRKDPEGLKAGLDRLRRDLMIYLRAAIAKGVTLISYADPSGGANIIGPRGKTWLLENFTIPFLNEIPKEWGKQVTVHLCPKTSFALIASGLGRFQAVTLTKAGSYGDAVVERMGKGDLLGDRCLGQWQQRILDGKIQVVKLKERA